MIILTIFYFPANAATVRIAKPGSGSGVIASNPPGIDCSNVCGTNAAGPFTLTATPDAYSLFGEWMGACAGQNSVCALPPGTSNQTVAAYFQGAALKPGLFLLKSCGTAMPDPLNTAGWPPLTGVIAIDAENIWAVKHDGTVWGFGCLYGMNGAESVNCADHHSGWTQASTLDNVIAIAGGVEHGLALKRDGTVWAWGSNFNGQLGNGTVDELFSTIFAHAPAPVPGLSDVIAIAAGGDHSRPEARRHRLGVGQQ